MFPSQLIIERSMILLGQDTLTLNQTTDVLKLALIQAPFAPGPTLAVADVDLADFDGSSPKLCDAGALPESLDPQNGDVLLDVRPDAGGFLFEVTGTSNLPQTIYGWAILNNDLSVLYGSEMLAAPITLTAVNQSLEIGRVTLRLPAGSLS